MDSIKTELTDKAFTEHINPIIQNPINAIIELIANAHDAGSTELYINWSRGNDLFSNNKPQEASFKDNGHGMSYIEFIDIWKQLSYNRIEKQGDTVQIVGHDINRKVYGRNGKGRHSPFAFTNQYTVITTNNYETSEFLIKRTRDSYNINPINKYKTKEKKWDNN